MAIMAINELIYARLKEVARAEQTITYGAIAPLAQLDLENPGDRVRIAQILDAINRFEHSEKRPMLSAVVINADSNQPGEGFFTVAREMSVQRHEDDLVFFVRELQRVHAYWKNHLTDV